MKKKTKEQYKDWIYDIKNKVERTKDFNEENYKKRQKAVWLFFIAGVLSAAVVIFLKKMMMNTESQEILWSVMFFSSLVVAAAALLSLLTNWRGYRAVQDVKIAALEIENEETTVDLDILEGSVAEVCSPEVKREIIDTCRRKGASEGLVTALSH